jgi:hypothetical protein
MTLDVPEIKDDLMDAKESLARGDKKEALTGILDLEKQLFYVESKYIYNNVWILLMEFLSRIVRLALSIIKI